MVSNWLGTSVEEMWLVVVSTIAILVAAITVIRIVGLRSLSKMSSFDFVVTVALGSTVATVAATSTSLWAGALAFITLLSAQWLVARLRRHARFSAIVDNEPRLLMVGSNFVDSNLRTTRVTHDDVFAKLREANVTDLSQVLAVVLETTGDTSVLHGAGPLDDALLPGVAGQPESSTARRHEAS